MAHNRKYADITKTVFKRLQQYKDRWTAYGANPGILALSEKLSPGELRRFEIFRDYNDEFLEKISPDISVAKWQKDSILFEEGTYIDLAFFVVQGAVEVYVQTLHERAFLSQPRFDLSRTMPPALSRVPSRGRKPKPKAVQKQNKNAGAEVFLSTMDFNFPASGTLKLGPGEIVGEIGAMSGWPQSVTARMAADGVLVQIRVPALRSMKRKSSALKQRLDEIYRNRSLAVQLKTTPLLQPCDEAFIESLTQKVELVSCEPNETVTQEGRPAQALYLVRSGFLKLSQKLSDGEIVVSYLSKGMTLGEAELLSEGTREWNYTATSVEFTELVKISRQDFYAIIKKFRNIENQLLETAVTRMKEIGANKENISQSQFIQAALEKGLVQGSSILVIDLDACTRCDDCVQACADTHGGLPRFVREGDKYENLLITKACYHCYDPVCLIGCPTGAIRRASAGEVVEIIDDLCIGCQACAKNCPYDAIVMHDTAKVWPDNMIPEILRGKERLLASKCDLCYKTNHHPACVSSCPHGCAFRVGSLEEFQQLLVKRR